MTKLPMHILHRKKADSTLRGWVRRFGVLLLLCALLTGSIFSAVSAAPLGQTSTPTAPAHIVISEFRTTGTGGGNDEFIELFNPTDAPVDISGWKIMASNASGVIGTRATIPSTLLTQFFAPGQHYLIANSVGYSGSVVPDLSYGTGIVDGGGIALTLADTTTIIDAVGMSAGSAYGEGTRLAALTGTQNRSYEREFGGAAGSCYDDNDNSADFQVTLPSNPENILSFITYCFGVLTVTPTSTLTPSQTPTETIPPVVTLTPTTTVTLTPTQSPTISSTLTPTVTSTPPIRSVLINEVAWSGTTASGTDEWIELYNPGSTVINLTGWTLTNSDSSISITFTGLILGNGYYLLERSDDNTISDVVANLIYTGGLDDSNESLVLRDGLGRQIDTANINLGSWPAGSSSPLKCSMERLSATALDDDSGWLTNNNSVRLEHDADGNSICGSPGRTNWAYSVTPTPSPVFTSTKTSTKTRTPTITKTPTKTRTPSITPTFTKTKTPTPSRTFTKTNTYTPAPLAVSVVVLNEFLVQPRSDWNNDGKVDAGDAFIEIKNVSSISASISGWYLDDQAGDSSPYYLPSITLEPGARQVYFASETGILLSEAFDSVRLYKPGAISDAYTYTGGVKFPNQSWCRLPDGANLSWRFGCQPTPGESNVLAQTIIVNDQSELAICLSKSIPTVVFDAECIAPGLSAWSPMYWLGTMQTRFPLYIQRDDQLDILD